MAITTSSIAATVVVILATVVGGGCKSKSACRCGGQGAPASSVAVPVGSTTEPIIVSGARMAENSRLIPASGSTSTPGLSRPAFQFPPARSKLRSTRSPRRPIRANGRGRRNRQSERRCAAQTRPHHSILMQRSLWDLRQGLPRRQRSRARRRARRGDRLPGYVPAKGDATRSKSTGAHSIVARSR